MFLFSILAAFGLGAFEVGLSLQSQQVWRWSTAALGGLFMACSVVMLIIQFGLFARMQQWMPKERLIVGGFVVMAVGFGLLGGTSIYFIVMALVGLVAFGSGLLLPTLSVAAADQPGPAVGTEIGFQNAAGNFGQAVGSAAAGMLFSAWPRSSFGVLALIMVASAAAAGWRLRRAATSIG